MDGAGVASDQAACGGAGLVTRRDILGLAIVLAIAAAVRAYQLSQPGGYLFDEWGYARDACWYLRHDASACGISGEITVEHPPLGKWLVASGIAVLGNYPIGWRLAPLTAGVLAVGFAFLLARRLTGSTAAALVAGGVLALDPLSVIMSRVAMLDVFTAAAGIGAIYFALLERDAMARGDRQSSSVWRPWLALAGLAAGAAVATKWSGVLSIVVVYALMLLWHGVSSRRAGIGWGVGLLRALPALTLWLVIVPALVYMASYVGRIDGELMGVPWHPGAWVHGFVERQIAMLQFHAGLDREHPYTSPAWSWLIGKRPVLLYFDVDPAGRIREILGFANLAIWLPGLVAALAAGFVAVHRRAVLGPEIVVAAGVGGLYLPWLALAAGRSFVFAYYALPTIPLLAVALGWAVAQMHRRARLVATGGVLCVALATFAFWQPLVYAQWLDDGAWRQRLLFTDCEHGGDEVEPDMPRGRGAPPEGWCWI